MAARYVSVTFLQTEKPRMSCTKYLERRIVRAWKSISRVARKSQNRASILPGDFVMLTARRRSVLSPSMA